MLLSSTREKIPEFDLIICFRKIIGLLPRLKKKSYYIYSDTVDITNHYLQATLLAQTWQKLYLYCLFLKKSTDQLLQVVHRIFFKSLHKLTF